MSQNQGVSPKTQLYQQEKQEQKLKEHMEKHWEHVHIEQTITHRLKYTSRGWLTKHRRDQSRRGKNKGGACEEARKDREREILQ